MILSGTKIARILQLLGSSNPIETMLSRLTSKSTAEKPLPPRIPNPGKWTKEAWKKRISMLESQGLGKFDRLLNRVDDYDLESMQGNIENFIGICEIPIGVIGPLRINGSWANGDFYVPLATTEGALVASYDRGSRLISMAGGVRVICLAEGVQRTPSFIFRNLSEVSLFLQWFRDKRTICQDLVSQTSRHAKLEDLKVNINGHTVTIVFEYTTGEASGQNMVTICTDVICQYIVKNSPVQAQTWYIEGNLAGDKKASHVSFSSVRGKAVTAEINIPREMIQEVLRVTPEMMVQYSRISLRNGIQLGSIGVNGHFANGLTAIFLACGQDVACVVEAATGTAYMEVDDDGGLYTSIALPNLIVGTVGGGTRFPTAQAALNMIGCTGEGSARKFAEICAATVLSGELSIIGAISSGDFAKAHQVFGRHKK